MNYFTSKNKSSRKQPINLAAVQNPDPYGSQLFCFRARFQTLFYLFIVFPTNTLRSSKGCKVAPYMKKSRPRLKSHSPTRATLGEPTFPTFLYRNLAFNYTRNKQWARVDPFFDGKVTFLAKPTLLQINAWLAQPGHYQLRQGERIRACTSAVFSSGKRVNGFSNKHLLKLSWAGGVNPGKFFSI